LPKVRKREYLEAGTAISVPAQTNTPTVTTIHSLKGPHERDIYYGVSKLTAPVWLRAGTSATRHAPKKWE